MVKGPDQSGEEQFRIKFPEGAEIPNHGEVVEFEIVGMERDNIRLRVQWVLIPRVENFRFFSGIADEKNNPRLCVGFLDLNKNEGCLSSKGGVLDPEDGFAHVVFCSDQGGGIYVHLNSYAAVDEVRSLLRARLYMNHFHMENFVIGLEEGSDLQPFASTLWVPEPGDACKSWVGATIGRDRIKTRVLQGDEVDCGIEKDDEAKTLVAHGGGGLKNDMAGDFGGDKVRGLEDSDGCRFRTLREVLEAFNGVMVNDSLGRFLQFDGHVEIFLRNNANRNLEDRALIDGSEVMRSVKFCFARILVSIVVWIMIKELSDYFRDDDGVLRLLRPDQYGDAVLNIRAVLKFVRDELKEPVPIDPEAFCGGQNPVLN